MYTHNLFPYPAKFPSKPITDFILEYSKKDDYILDPFCGSGTVLVESLLNGRNAVGIDLNPVSALISNAKSRIYTEKDLTQAEAVANELEKFQIKPTKWFSNNLKDWEIQCYDNIDHWFEANMKLELSFIKHRLLLNTNYNKNVDLLLWMAFLHSIIPISKQETDTRYASITKKEHVDGYAIRKFRSILLNYITILRDYISDNKISSHKIKVYEGDSTLILDKISASKFKLAITSPPYINTFDYYLYHKHRIYWMDKAPQEVRKNEIGCHHRIDTMTFENALNEYNENIKLILEKTRKALVRGGRFVWLIGDGIVKGELIKANSILEDLASKTGFSVESMMSRSLREVSRGFLKGKNLDLKKHHVIVLKKR